MYNIYIYIYNICVFVCSFLNLFYAGMVKPSQKCDEVKVDQWIDKNVNDVLDRKEITRKKAKEGR